MGLGISVLTNSDYIMEKWMNLKKTGTCKVGLCNGGLLGILSFALIGLYIYLFKGKTLLFSYAVSGCIGVALLLAMLISSAVGTCIPLFFKKINIDPAEASGPLITTVNCCSNYLLWPELAVLIKNAESCRLNFR